MARGISAEERKEAITLVPSDEAQPVFGSDTDTEQAWNGWFDSLQNAEAQGKIRVAKVPTNEDGSPNLSSKGQVQLLAVPHDQYDFDELCNIIRKDFMEPGETMCVRIMGFRAGKAGLEFNRIMMLKRSKSQLPAEAEKSQLGEVLRAMQESQRQQAEMLERVMTSRAPAGTGMGDLKEIMIAALPTLGTVLAAWIAKPAPKNELGSLIDAVMKLKDVAGGGGGEDSNDSSTLGIIKAVAPAGLQLLNTLAANHPPQNRVAASIPHQPNSPRLAAPQPQGMGNIAPMAAAPTPEQLAPSISSTPEQKTMFSFIKEQTVELIKLCDAGETPEAVAKIVVAMIPPEYDDQLFNLIETPKTFAVLGMVNPEVKTPVRAPWFEALRVALNAEMTAGDAAELRDAGDHSPAT